MSDKPTDRTPDKERFCCYCGASLGRYKDYDRYDTCGEIECNREARGAIEQEMDERIDRVREDYGY